MILIWAVVINWLGLWAYTTALYLVVPGTRINNQNAQAALARVGFSSWV